MRMLLLAPPGAGKGTQGARLAEHFGVRHIAAGELFREHISRQSELGRAAKAYVDRGELVPDSLVLDLIMPVVVAATAEGGYVLDGFPRTMPQALAAAELGLRLGVRFHAVVYLDVAEDELVRRLRRRAKEQGRADDTADVIRHRLRVFGEKTRPLIEYYRSRGILVSVDGDQPVEEVTSDILRALSALPDADPHGPESDGGREQG
jgi:adenylate kinase